MSMRAVVVGLVALLLCSRSEAAPAKHVPKRKGTFAAYIDPAAPPDPPRPAPRKPERVSIVLLIDQTMTSGQSYESIAWTAGHDLRVGLLGEDLVAVMAFESRAKVVVKPVWPDDYDRVIRAIEGLEPVRGPSDLAGALDEARSYIAPAPGRKLIVLVTNKARLDDKLEAALAAIRTDAIAFVVAGTWAGHRATLAKVADAAGGTFVHVWDDHDAPTKLEAEVRALHYR